MSTGPVPRTVELRRSSRAQLWAARCSAGARDAPFSEQHSEWCIALVSRGEFLYRPHDARRAQALRPGWLLLGRKDAEYVCSHEHDGGDDCLVLSLAPELLTDVARATDGFTGAFFPRAVLPPIARLSAAMRLAHDAARSREALDLDEVALEVASSVASAFAGAPPARGPERRAADVARVRDAIQLLEDRCAEPWSLGDVADLFDLSPFHFLRLFREVAGVTPHQYLVGARVRRAVALLLDTSRPVTSVAYDVGFGDLSNFIRTFQRQIGASPSAFRRRAKGR